MAPRTRKSANQTAHSATSAGTSPSSSPPHLQAPAPTSVRKPPRQGSAATPRGAPGSTQNATNFTLKGEQETAENYQESMDESMPMDSDLSEVGDFESSSSASRPSTSTAHGKRRASGAKSSAAVTTSGRKRARGTSTTLPPVGRQKQRTIFRRDDVKEDYDGVSDQDMRRKSVKEDDVEWNIPGSDSDGGSEFCMDEDQSSEDEDDWEEVSVSGMVGEHSGDGYKDEDEVDEAEEVSGPWQYNAVEIVFDKPLQEIKKRSKNKGVTKEERMIRILIHQTHLLCLIASGLRRNGWISHPKLSAVALSLVPAHIAQSVQTTHADPIRDVNALQVLALWWRDSFVVTGPGIQSREYLDIDVVGVEAAIPVSNEECLKLRKNLQRRLLNRTGSTDVCSQLFTAICRALGLKARLVESLQACTFKVSPTKEELAPSDKAGTGSSSRWATLKKVKKKKEVELDESDTTRGSRVVLLTPHRMPKRPTKLPPNHKLADPPVFWTEVYSVSSQKWITIDPVRGFVNSPLKMHPPSACSNNVLAYVVAYDEENYVTDVTRRYTSAWGTTTKKQRVQPAGNGGFDWWARTMSGLTNPHRTAEKGLEEEELLQAEVSERMPTKLGDFNNHPLYALERHLKKFEVLYPRIPILGHIRGEAIYPRTCVKQVKSKENWLRRGRVLESGETMPIKWVKSHAATIFQMRLRQQMAISDGGSTNERLKRNTRKRGVTVEDEDDKCSDDAHERDQVLDQGQTNPTKNLADSASEEGGADQIPLFGEWQTEAYQPPWVINGKVPRNQYGRQDVFTSDMVPLGGSHLKGRNIAQVARLLGVDHVEAVTGFEFHSRRSVPVIQGIIVPTEQAEVVLDAYHEIAHQRDQEAHKKTRTEVLKRWRKLIKGVLMRSRLMEEYGEEDEGKDVWVPQEDDEDQEEEGRGGNEHHGSKSGSEEQASAEAPPEDSGAGFMID